MSSTDPAVPERLAHPTLPITGHPAIDAALAGLALGDDVHAHHDEIVRALEVVQQSLNPTGQPPLPRG